MRHGRGAFLSFAEKFFSLAYLGALQVTDFNCNIFHRACNNAERGKEMGVTIARDNLR